LDDAAVYRLDDEQALIVTTDFFTPIVDDPYDYGAIAAANALSDIYAMGGRPLLALNIAAFPPDLPPEILTEVMRGAAEKVQEADAIIAGGHTIQDKEPKVGLAVVGIARPDRLLIKGGGQPGDALVLTKPLGTGLITTAAKNDKADPAHLAEAVGWMTRLNRAAAEAASAVGSRSATDITGFGLLGHATEMADGGGVTFVLRLDAMPFLPGVDEYADQWLFPGGSAANMQAYEAGVQFAEGISSEEKMLLFDAQTSGGLLIAVPEGQLDAFGAEMDRRDAPWWHVGTVVERGDVAIVVER
jgi:selenide,water dikinase